MENYEKLKSIIQAANPEIMRLNFGCELKANNTGKRRFFVGSNYEEGELYFADLDQVGSEDQTFYTEEYEEDVKKELILGRPIRLADVLLAISQKISPQHSLWQQERFYIWDGNKSSLWNPKDDNLDNQSEECKQFLINLLVVT